MSAGLARWANRLGVFIQGLIACTGWIIGMALCALALGDAGSVVFLPLLLVMPLMLAAVVIHEGGHYLAARSAGMTVLRMGIGRVELMPQRHGWRIRWAARGKIKAAGYVIATHDPARPLRTQSLRMIVGGPGANLVAAVIVGLLALPWLPHAVAWLTLAFALVNATVGLANLIPSSRGLGSDGLLLWLWRDRQREHSPQLAHVRLLALTVSGLTADRLPQDHLAELDGQPAPMPMVALWYRLKAHQNRGEWQQAAAAQAAFEQLSQALPPAMKRDLADFLACIRTELAFSRAMRDTDGGGLVDGLLPKQATWSAPVLWPRCLALRALLEGDRTKAQCLLDEVQQLAGQSLDRALAPSEALIRHRMLALVPDAQTPRSNQPG